MILRDRCSTSYDLASLFRGRRSTLDRWSGKIAKRIGTRPSALHSNFHFWRKSRRIVSFLMLSTSKNDKVSQNCFVFDVVKCKNWGSLAVCLGSPSLPFPIAAAGTLWTYIVTYNHTYLGVSYDITWYLTISSWNKSLVSEKLCTYKLVNVFINGACLEVIWELWNLAFSCFLIYMFFYKDGFCKKTSTFCGFGSCIEIIDLADDRLSHGEAYPSVTGIFDKYPLTSEWGGSRLTSCADAEVHNACGSARMSSENTH